MVGKGADQEEKVIYMGKEMTYKKCFEMASLKKSTENSKKEMKKEGSKVGKMWKGSGFFTRKKIKESQGF